MPQYIKRFPKALPHRLCKLLIEKFITDKNVISDPQPFYSTRKYINISLQPSWRRLEEQVLKFSNQVALRYFNKPGEVLSDVPERWGNDGFILARYDAGDICALHYDGQSGVSPHNALRLATQLFYLNDVTNGGETYFPLQKLKIKPDVGKAIVFPVSFTYPHEVLAATEPRYVLQTWITDPNYVVLHATTAHDDKQNISMRRSKKTE